MPGFKPFLAGMLAGGCLAVGALQYHVVRSNEGMFLVPRSPKPSLTQAYADTRGWTDEQWNRYPAIVTALKANGAADLLNSDGEKLSLSEIQNTMKGSLNDGGPFDLDIGSDFVANKPAESVGEPIDHIPLNTVEPNRRDGFLDEVRQELNRSFGDESYTSNNNQRAPTPPSNYDALRDARERMQSTLGDSLDYDAFSESLNDFGETSRPVESPQPFSNFTPSDLRRRSFESEANQSDGNAPLSAPDFDDDDDILNRFAPRSGAANPSTNLAYDDGWAADPWAQTSHTTETAVKDVVTKASASDDWSGWKPTQRDDNRDQEIVSGVIDRLKQSAGSAASESVEKTRRAITNPLESTFNDARSRALGAVSESVKNQAGSATDWLGKSVSEVLQPDADGLFSPFGELPE